ncbi:type VI secretion system tip protein VgrG [Burkholderia sp. Bp8992]|uniref:type VI secretion system Vgr family protein n=1 Tax=Burkholderia sp. Bp8992 TaxID=2184554 RepID=UPI000F580BDB|nr:type VI secretion system Vgr family protein [Burkholderia sp. Bp8992]RQS26678.1 type VI secretion system tip protein VgrG [Burkholderia sp. Bp8992]
MALFDASRTLTISGAALPMYGDRPILTPVKLTGGETLGELFEYTVELKTPDELGFSQSIAANIDLDKLIGTELTVSIQLEGVGHFIRGLAGKAGMANIGAGTREITGIVTNASILREDGRSIVYAVTLRPWFWLATKNCDCRIFQDMSVIEITDAVLAAYLFPVDKRLTPPRPNKTWPKRDIQRQHYESDWTFLQRLWEEWGIFYFFEHDEGKHRLVLCDSIAALKPHGNAYSTIRYQAPNSRRIDEEHIHALSVSNALTAGAVTSVDYDYNRPRADLTVGREDPRNTGLANQEHYVWGDYAQPQAGTGGLSGAPSEPRTEAEYLTLVQMQAYRCQGLKASGQGNLRGLVTGQTFVLSHYPQSAANCEYAVITARLTIEEVGEASGSGQRYHCEADFVLQPTHEPFRLPRSIAKPRITGVEYAIVTCPESQEIWTDAYGRVKVQFLWDRLGDNDERSSCWVRVAGAWRGDQFGAIFLPRRGHEVEVAFANGDPDLPIIVGSAVNAFNMPPFGLPENQALAGFRSKEIGARRANTLAFDDTHGKIQAHLSSDEGSSQLNLGYITRIAGNAGRQEERGRGFELATGLWGVVRSALGMLVTTEARPDAEGHVKGMGETVRRLMEARDTHERLAQLAQQNHVQEVNSDQSEVTTALNAQNDALRGGAESGGDPFPEFAEPHLTLASPAGIQTTTPGSTHVASGEHLALTTGEHLGIATGRSLFATIKEKLRIFVYDAGIKLIAGAGSIDIESLKDTINLMAKIRIRQTATKIEIWAEEELSLRGGKSFITLNNSGITNGTPGQWQSYAAIHEMPGPRSASEAVPAAELKVCEMSMVKAAVQHAAIVPLS